MDKDKEFYLCIKDIIYTEPVQEMERFIQHGSTTCLTHCLNVSYYCYKLSKLLSFDAKSAARAGLLHDLFLYDWHNRHDVLHSYMHPRISLYNANRYFNLNSIEKDMIEKHMFPLTLAIPKYKETVIIILVDKFCAIMETLKIIKFKKIDICDLSVWVAYVYFSGLICYN